MQTRTSKGQVIGNGTASVLRGAYYMYKVEIYEGLSYNAYIKKKESKTLPTPIITQLARDAWNNTQGRSLDRYGPKNETPPGIYWLTYYPNGIGSKGYKLKISDTKDGDYINGIHGKREGVRIHHYSPHFAEGCITTGDNNKKSVDDFINKIPSLKKKPIKFVIEERKVKYINGLFKGVK